MTEENILQEIKELLNKKTVLVGVGNTLQGDDGAGSCLAQNLAGQIPWPVIDAGVCPENYLGKISAGDPEVVIFIDALAGIDRPGDLALIGSRDLDSAGLSTHSLPLSVLAGLLEEKGCQVYILGIQPGRTVLGEGIGPEVRASLKKLEEFFTHASRSD